MRPIVTDRVASLAWSVGRSVGLSAKTAAPINMPFGVRTRVSPGNHVSDGGPDPPMGRVNFEGGGASHCKVGYSAVICAQTAKPIEMPFALWTWMGRRHRGSNSPWERATLTLLLRNCTVDFVETCNVCARKAILKAAKRIF